mgnify:FL=1
MKLSHNQLVKLVAEQTNYHEYEVKDVLEGLATVLARVLNEGNTCCITGVGIFSKRKGNEREFKSGLTGELTKAVTKSSISIRGDSKIIEALN